MPLQQYYKILYSCNILNHCQVDFESQYACHQRQVCHSGTASAGKSRLPGLTSPYHMMVQRDTLLLRLDKYANKSWAQNLKSLSDEFERKPPGQYMLPQ